ncbi:MAG: cyanophycinase [Usitatibacteraceae bacterium]
MPSKVAEGAERGWIIPIGGAEEKENSREILRRFVDLCAANGDADIVVIPTASQLADTGARYERIFTELGVAQVTAMDFDTRRDCEEGSRLARLQSATGVFFTGGNQLRLSTILGGTSVAKALRLMNAGGVHVAGTSAGAAFISEHMIAFGEEGASPIAGAVRLAPGLGLTNRFIIDQHFRQRDRLGRLLAALAFNPFAIGLGLDEDTAAFIGPDNTLEATGSGSITVVDASGIEFSSMDTASEGQPVCMLGIAIHILTAGANFNLHTRKASPGKLTRAKK